MRQILFAAVLVAACGCAATVPPSKSQPAESTAEIVHTRLGETLRVTGPKYAPKLLKSVEPIYPEEVRTKSLSGVVKMTTLISAEGNIADAQVVEGLPYGLSEAAVQAVRQWKFAPTVRNGVAVPVLFEVSISFKLR